MWNACLFGLSLAVLLTISASQHPQHRQWRSWPQRHDVHLRQNHMRTPGGINRIRRMGIELRGPHVCGDQRSNSRYCCPGWLLDKTEKHCTKPKCDEGACVGGFCEMPNFCHCSDGSFQKHCPRERDQGMKCNIRCENGGVCIGNQCKCPYGYTGPFCTQVVCGPGCLNGGRCVIPGKCSCVYGFTGMRCERDYRKGPCFLTRTNSTCTNEISNVMCTKLFCCATVGEGWGHPCEECPARVGNCTKGRLPPHCTDINECEIMPGLCSGGTCVNTDGSFKCECPDGFHYNSILHQCEDVNECLTNVCANGHCLNNDGSFVCECDSNYQLSSDGRHCVSNVPGRCYTAIESGMCASPLSNLVVRTACCCMPSGQETLGKCFAAVGQFPERCAAIGTPEYERDCRDIVVQPNICGLMEEQACVNGVCVEQPEQNSFYCECNEGYMASDDGKGCQDLNECSPENGQGRDICGSFGTCLNTDGSYTCHCHPGFEHEAGSMTSCVDIDECSQVVDVTNGGRCDNGNCVNTKGSFVCDCHDGFRLSATQQKCDDINECEDTEGLCEHGRCLNTLGMFRCLCHPGYYLSSDEKECLDENECEHTNMCLNGECVNMDGRFKCVCHDGYRLLSSGDSCADIDECVNNPCINGECVNGDGSFTCNCHRFQVLDDSGTRCVSDLTEGQCFRNVRNGQCRPHNALHLATTRADCCCSVPGASSAWGDDCEPCAEQGEADYAVLCANFRVRNKCELMENPCNNGHCINMGNNAFRCECDTGFLVADDQQSCIDFDECTQNLCSNGVCRNTPGSYSCTCNLGFLLRGDVCEDVDECLSNPCTNARCRNEPGTYRCVCEEGAILDTTQHICYDARLGRCWRNFNDGQCQGSVGDTLITAEQCCNSVGEAWGFGTSCIDCDTLEFKCTSGYMLEIKTDQCVDIDECKYGVCDPDAECINTVGSFRCVCKPGLTLNAEGTTCLDLRVGLCYLTVTEDGVCEDTSESKLLKKSSCCCTVGLGWGDDCEVCPLTGTPEFVKLCQKGQLRIRINECIDFPNLCVNGQCTNTDSSFACICERGFSLDESGRNCSDINECVISPGLCLNGVCENTHGGFQCNCDVGYEPSSNDVCVDIDECSKAGYCTGGSCMNTEGSYKCTCPAGRSLSADGLACVDVDECALRPDLCEPNGRCENMLGYYMCLCDIGYQATVDAQDCVDVNECEQNDGGCHMGCHNTIGSYECTCDEGFVLTFDRHTCADKDECREQTNRCGGGTCENTNGAFRCVCFDGYMATHDLQFCEDIDECAMNPNACMHGRCHNTRGSYTCQCDEGYCVPQGQMICVDEDECEMSKHNCHVNADCNNTEGAYTCKCIDGFHGDGFMCHDDNECELGTHLCHEHAICRNKLGTYTCDCDAGYHGDGFSCSDNDDCIEDETLCGPFGECVNVDGSFQCQCSMGFDPTEDLKACKDIDECAIEHVCVNGRCHNVPGNFRCVCLKGFEKDEQGANCTDVNECEEVANCINGICVNSPGNYECQCPEGFEPNPTHVGCVDNRVGDCFWNKEGDDNAPICTNAIGVQLTKSHCCCSNASGWGNPCEICPQPDTPEYEMLCPGGFGFVPNPITVLLEDINECVRLPGLCQGGQCINVFGSFQCVCSFGFVLNTSSRVCEDVNECIEDPDVCGTGKCNNEVGGYNCVCPVGYKSIQGGRKCEDIREAACHRYYNATSNECSSELTFETTKKKCCCIRNIGRGWNNPCEACPSPRTPEFLELCGTEEPTTPEGICNTPVCRDGVCIETDDGYRCECKKGYHYNEDLIICEDDDECLDEDLCFENAECTNTPGSYLCACKQGFRFNEATDSCDDIDDCQLPGICANGVCTNNHGGFVCDCNQGFRSVNDDRACEDMNECELSPCGHGVCSNVFGSYSCHCDTGFRLSDNADCVDINECADGDQCRNGECDNLPGDFACRCGPGYTVTPDGRICIDTNECQQQPTICGVGTCQNMDGTFKCYCPDGFDSPDGNSCQDINECELDGMCKFGRCENTQGSYNCICPENFLLSLNGKLCQDMREEQCFDVVNSAGECSVPGRNLITFSQCCCRCTGGGWGSDELCTACPAINSTEFIDLCPNGCGFSIDGTDINECVANDPCINARCVNQAGSYKCICRRGFELDSSNIRCVDVNECETGNPCLHGTCENTEGMFECICDHGYYNGPAMSCLDVDECKDPGLNQCGFRCENTDGDFHCACPNGFKLRPDKKMCEDVDECASDLLNDCTAKGMTCKNIVGHYMCTCPDGFRRIGTSDNCVDINECDQIRVCSNGICINEEGTYTCQCNEGYVYDSEHQLCLDTRQGPCYVAVHQRMCEVTSTTGLPFTKAECCCGKGKGWGDNCEECPTYGTGSFLQLCPHGPGFQLNGNDIDDCRVLPGLCAHGTCINTLGSFRCACDHGFEPAKSKQVCLDINECLETPSPCSFDCRNTVGSYECVCPKGYQVDSDSRSCVDVDECATKRHNCQYLCMNTVGAFKCGCPRGFVKEGAQCVDKNECVDDPSICGSHGMCRNELGTYHCDCPRGFRKGPDQTCMDIDECSTGRGACRNCDNTPGSYRCPCATGYASNLYGRGCTDVNECVHSPCGHGQNCQNTNGGFQCGCGRGLTKVRGGCADIDECQMGGGSCNFGCRNTYRGFSCSCPNGFFKLGSGHCMNSRRGFQQQIPRYPQYPQYPPMYGRVPMGRPQQGYGQNQQQDTVCYNCMPGGDVRRRQRRSASQQGRYIEKQDLHGKASVNTTYPIELFLTTDHLNHRTRLLNLLPSLKQLRNHARYSIVSGNEDRRFRLHNADGNTFLHFAKHMNDVEDTVIISSGVYDIRLRATTGLSKDQVKQASLESEIIEEAIESEVTLDIKVHVEDP